MLLLLPTPSCCIFVSRSLLITISHQRSLEVLVIEGQGRLVNEGLANEEGWARTHSPKRFPTLL